MSIEEGRRLKGEPRARCTFACGASLRSPLTPRLSSSPPYKHAVSDWREQGPDTDVNNMASTPDDPTIPFIPPEICLAVAQHVQRTDLANFRLANKTLAEAGRSEMFRTIILRCTLASWSAFKRVKEHEQISKLIRTLILDVTSWRVGTDVRDWHEWTRYCESQANHYTLTSVDPEQAALYKELAESRYRWEAYLTRLEEEKAVEKEIAASMMSADPLPELPSLRKVHVIRGAYRLKDHHVCRLQELKRLPVTAPLSAWRGDSFSQVPNALKLVPIQRITVTAPNTTKWRIDGYTAAEHSRYVRTYSRNPNITSFKLRFGTSDHGQLPSTCPRYFQRYLNQWPNLESLTLDLHNRISDRDNGTSALQTIQSIFGVEGESAAVASALGHPLILQRLRKLSLCHIDTTPKALMSLIVRHRSTLRDLRLHAIWIHHNLLGNKDEVSAQHSWQEVFSSIRTTTDLEHLKLSGLFRNRSVTHDDWNFDVGGLGEYVADGIMTSEQRSDWQELMLGLPTLAMGHTVD